MKKTCDPIRLNVDNMCGKCVRSINDGVGGRVHFHILSATARSVNVTTIHEVARIKVCSIKEH